MTDYLTIASRERESKYVPPSSTQGDAPKRNTFMFFKLRVQIRVMMPVIYSFFSYVVMGLFYVGEYGD